MILFIMNDKIVKLFYFYFYRHPDPGTATDAWNEQNNG